MAGVRGSDLEGHAFFFFFKILPIYFERELEQGYRQREMVRQTPR